MKKRETLLAYPAKEYETIPEKTFLETMQTQVAPKLEQLRRSRLFDREDTQKLYCEYYCRTEKQTRGTIFISHGFAESCSKYHEVIYYMLQEGYQVVLIEHRGHGRSRRPEEKDFANTPTHMEHFQDYVDDMDHIVREILQKEMPGPYFLFAHSMGGAVAATYIEQHPDVFQKAIFTAPMFEINRKGIPKPLAKFIGFWNCATGKSKEFTVAQKPFSLTPDFSASPCTGEARYLYYFHQQLAHPEYQSAGSSNRWARECLRACDILLKPENCRKVNIPVLLFQADQDDFVYPGGQNRFIRQIPDGELVFVPGSKHEIYMSSDEITQKYWGIIFDFLAR